MISNTELIKLARTNLLGDSKKLTGRYKLDLYEKLKHKIGHKFFFIEPWKLNEKTNMLKEEMKGIVSMLMEIPKFWEHKVIIDSFYSSREEWISHFNEALPDNARKAQWDTSHWIIENQADEKYKAVGLASIFAWARSQEEMNDIRKVWGEIGSSGPADPVTLEFIARNPKCPYIKKNTITYERIINNKNDGVYERNRSLYDKLRNIAREAKK